MKIQSYVRKALLCALTAGLLPPVAGAAETSASAVVTSPGTIVGVVTNTAKLPVARATVTASKVGGGGIRATVSGSDGVYSFADLPPGVWALTSQVDGLPEVTTPPITVVASKATRYDITVAGAPAAAVVAAPTPAPASTLSLKEQIAQIVPEALQAPDAPPEHDTVTPFADVDTTWANGTSRNSTPIFDTKFFTPEIRFDAYYAQSGNHPKDHTIDGSTEEFRSGEFQVEQVSFGGDFHWNGVKARFLSMMGLFSVTTPRNDASAGVGQWDLQGAYKYFSEANAGYHWDVAHGLNVDLGVFVSYIGLFSYYNFDNWVYQPSFVSSNTPWFFNGLRIQFYPTQHLKIEPWIINGWQSYARFNKHLGFGGQIEWIPNDNLKFVANTYAIGQDNLSYPVSNGQPYNAGDPYAAVGSFNGNAPPVDYSKVQRVHEDDSILVKYYDAHGQNGHGISKMAFSLTVDVGCEYGGGVQCGKGPNNEGFFGAMLYDRTWWDNNKYAVTIGGGFMDNPGRYLALLPPINGATALTGTPYFSEQPGLKLFQWDTQLNFQYMPNNWITWWMEGDYRHSNVPYWTGSGGITPPNGNTGAPASQACMDSTVASNGACASGAGLWVPDLRRSEILWGAGVMVKF
jgi:hypothetical protein